MPRATFAGVTFDLLVQGLQDTHEGQVTVREVPSGDHAYVDLGGPRLARRSVTVKLDDQAAYLALAALPGTAASQGVLHTDAEGDQPAVLLSVSRTLRRAADQFQLCRTEWVFLPEAPP